MQGWQLVGLANGPIFGAATAIQGRLVAKFERRKKRCRDEVNKKYYDSVANIRAIRGTHLTVNEVSLTNPYAVFATGLFYELQTRPERARNSIPASLNISSSSEKVFQEFNRDADGLMVETWRWRGVKQVQ